MKKIYLFLPENFLPVKYSDSAILKRRLKDFVNAIFFSLFFIQSRTKCFTFFPERGLLNQHYLALI